MVGVGKFDEALLMSAEQAREGVGRQGSLDIPARPRESGRVVIQAWRAVVLVLERV